MNISRPNRLTRIRNHCSGITGFNLPRMLVAILGAIVLLFVFGLFRQAR